MDKNTAVTETPAELEQVIKRILDVDLKARSITNEASGRRADAERSILDKKAALREDYLNKARAKIEMIRETEEKAADAAIEESKAEQEELLAVLEEQYSKNKARYVNEIFDRIIAD